MKKEIITSERLGEQYTVLRHQSGCTICLYPTKEKTAVAQFSTRYGSVDTTFKTAADPDYVTVPEGIAHYLEHKLFESDECNVFDLFAETGANVNAYTSFDATTYLFLSTKDFAKNLRLLLNFVQQPYFTDENVEKERGIIEQEIKMYLDDPGTRVFYNCLDAVYHRNPVRIDIAGTVESIQKIDKELLYRCYNTFYNLNNMVLTIVGNFDPDEAIAICDELLKPKDDPEISVLVPEEPPEVREKYAVQTLPCAVPLFTIGLKMPLPEKSKQARLFILLNLALDTALGKNSDFYCRLYDEGMIDDSFGAGVFQGRGFFLPFVSGESRDPSYVRNEVLKELERCQKEGLSREDFEIVKKMTYGDTLKSFENVGGIGRKVLNAHLFGSNAYVNMEYTATASYEEVGAVLRQLDLGNHSLSVVEPPKEKEE